jgi:hypothetical protein
MTAPLNVALTCGSEADIVIYIWLKYGMAYSLLLLAFLWIKLPV